MKHLQAQFDDLRNSLQQGGNTSNSPSQDIDATSAVIGGLQGLSTSEQAIQWLSDKLTSLSMPQPARIKMPSKEFKGVLIAKFTTPAARGQAIHALRASLHKPGEDAIWAKEDLPVHVSARKAFLNSLRYQLNKWDFVYDEMDIDAEYTTLTVGSKTVLKLTIAEGKLDFDWCQDWA